MKDVAALAGVSLSTVSRAVNGTSGVDAELAARVHEAARLLGYRRDHAASTLRRADRQSASVGLIFDDVSNPYSSALHRGVEEVARARGVLTFAGSSDQDPERERDLAQALFARRVDGLIIVPAGSDQGYLRREREAGVALVFVDRPPVTMDADAVLADNAGGTAAGVAHLVAAGHRRIGYLGDRSVLHTAVARVEGYRWALGAHGIAYDPALVRLELGSSEESRRAAGELLAGPDAPTALFAGQNLVTIGAVHALREADLHRRVALVGFDDLILADALEPGLTVVAQDAGGIGRAAAELLFARLDGNGGPYRQVVLPTRLIARGSGEISPPRPARRRGRAAVA